MSSVQEIKKGDLAAKINFPLYGVKMLTERHFVVAGGGGAARTGVSNGFTIYQLGFCGSTCTATEIGKHDTGTVAIMNFTTHCDATGQKMYIVAGQDGHSQLYFISKKFEIVRSLSYSDNNDKDVGMPRMRQRKPENVPAESSSGETRRNSVRNGTLSQKKLRMFAHPMDSVQTDMSKEEPFQKVIRISSNGKIMATGGADGFVRLWQFPAMKPLQEIKAHTKEVDDIDFSPDGQKVVSVSRDANALVWSVKDGKKLSCLEWTAPNNAKYLFKRCRFSTGDGESQRPRLFTIVNPASQSRLVSYLQHWDTSTFLLAQSVPLASAISALAVSPCGKFVAVGSMFGGSVDVYTAFNLRRIKHVEAAHSNFVTGLEFVPCHTEAGQAVTGQSEAAVISISVDNQIRVHRIPFQWRTPVWIAVLLIIATLVLTFMLCSYLGL